MPGCRVSASASPRPARPAGGERGRGTIAPAARSRALSPPLSKGGKPMEKTLPSSLRMLKYGALAFVITLPAVALLHQLLTRLVWP